MGAPDEIDAGLASEASTLHSVPATGDDKEHVSSSPSNPSVHDAELFSEKKGVEAVADEEASPAAAAPSSGIPSFMDPSQFPDGGVTAWLVVLGAMCSLFVSFGWINCIGVFQDYYERNTLRAYSPSTIAWIPSLETFVMFVGGAPIGRLYDNYGPRYLLLAGTFFHVFGLMMASISTEYYQLILSQGVCSPIGASMIFYPSMNTVVTWFYAKRGLALGLTAMGSSLGGVIFPIMVSKLVPRVGFGWTMRICAFLILALMVVANLTIRSRIPPQPRPVKLMDFINPLRELPFALIAIGMFLFFFGLFEPFTFLILEGTERGVPVSLGVYLVSILNAASVFGRTLPGYWGDKLGRANVITVMMFFTAILTLALWLPGSGTAAVVTFAVLFGFSSGSIVSLAPALLAQISDVRQIGVRTGTIFAIVAVAVLIGSPIGGALVVDDHGGFWKLQVFAGVMMLAGSCFMLAARVRIAGPGLKVKI